MRTTENDIKEAHQVHAIICRVGGNESKYAEVEYDLIYQQQPFLISLILGYRVDLNAIEFERITKCIFIIWEYFKPNEKVQRSKIDEEQFDRIHTTNIHFLKYFIGEAENSKEELFLIDFENLKSKVLFTSIMHQLNIQNPSKSVNSETTYILLIGMKCLIECFEEITKEA